MADFVLDAEIRVKADQSLREIDKFKNSLKGSKKEFSLFGKTIALDSRRIAAGIALIHGIASKMFASIVASSPSVRAAFKEMEISVFEMSLSIGEDLAPVIEDTLVPAFEALRTLILNLDPEVRQFIGILILTTLAVTALAIAVAVLTFVGAPILIAIIAIAAALAILIFMWQNNTLGVRDLANAFVKDILPNLKLLALAFKLLFVQLKELFRLLSPILIVIIAVAFIALKTSINAATQVLIIIIAVIIVLVAILNVLLRGITALVIAAKDFFNIMVEDLGITEEKWLKLLETIKLFVEQAKIKFSGFLEFIKIIFNAIEDTINKALGPVRELIRLLKEAIDLGDITGGIKETVSDIIGQIPGFAEGGEVERTGIIFAHKGEQVLRPVEARQFRAGGGSGGGGVTFNNTFNIGTVQGSRDIHKIIQAVERSQKRQMARKANL